MAISGLSWQVLKGRPLTCVEGPLSRSVLTAKEENWHQAHVDDGFG